MKINRGFIFILLLVIIGCDGKRNIDEKARRKKLSPNSQAEGEQCNLNKLPPYGRVTSQSLGRSQFLTEKIIDIETRNICHGIIRNEYGCYSSCTQQTTRLILEDNYQITDQYENYDFDLSVKCKKYQGPECVSFLITHKVLKDKKEVSHVNTTISKRGTFTLTGKIDKTELTANTGEIWLLHELGNQKTNFFLATNPNPLENLEEVYTYIGFNHDNGSMITPMTGSILLYLPRRSPGDEILDYSSLGIVKDWQVPVSGAFELKQMIGVLNAEENFPLKIEMEYEVEI
ncbi:MAG: hypothetical protein CME62_15100 [Halobacteriovoraceae bacterium]|nr:hypothetical protein [Halobacteriovoraceae bacterium]|tara:strand:- start:20318 stop:21181 length:864 start_codon:yes stop_codon:yes gene_type:complete